MMPEFSAWGRAGVAPMENERRNDGGDRPSIPAESSQAARTVPYRTARDTVPTKERCSYSIMIMFLKVQSAGTDTRCVPWTGIVPSGRLSRERMTELLVP